uniref:Uncharacterized protein n=1 Tax=Myoviridae sp. ctMb725 TaxID=2825088 RepID=A0A8S5PVS5_9CAUD|nr:MAG TPA: hypothetical protein [Myoviridae sp. ctMb725]
MIEASLLKKQAALFSYKNYRLTRRTISSVPQYRDWPDKKDSGDRRKLCWIG